MPGRTPVPDAVRGLIDPQAASLGWLRFVAPSENELTERLGQEFPWLTKAEVVHTSVIDDVAYRGAITVLEILRKRTPSTKEIHIGFAVGKSMRKVAEKLAEQLSQPWSDLPETLAFHSLVSGFDVHSPLCLPKTTSGQKSLMLVRSRC